MAKIRGKKALYEVMGRALDRSSPDNTLQAQDRLRSEQSQSEALAEKTTILKPSAGTVKWLNRPGPN